MRSFFTPPLTGKHVLLIMVAFFATIIAVNGVFVYQALHTWTGLDRPNAYMEGLAYNKTLAMREAQRRLHWHAALTVDTEAGRTITLTTLFRDRSDAPLNGLAVTALVRRPTQEGYDQTVSLAPAGDGLYRGSVRLPLPGQWQVRLTATSRNGATFFAERRIRIEDR